MEKEQDRMSRAQARRRRSRTRRRRVPSPTEAASRPREPRARVRDVLDEGGEREDVARLLVRHGFDDHDAEELADLRFRKYQDELREQGGGIHRAQRPIRYRTLLRGVVLMLAGAFASRQAATGGLVMLLGLAVVVFSLVHPQMGGRRAGRA